jgi:hypothetical protein
MWRARSFPLFLRVRARRASRDEFLRRWELLPNLKRAELLDGIVYMGSPVSEFARSLAALGQSKPLA